MKRGDMIRVLQMEDYNGIDIQAAKMNGNIYIVDYVDDAGQIHLQESGLAIIPEVDKYILIDNITEFDKEVSEIYDIVSEYLHKNDYIEDDDGNDIFAKLNEEIRKNAHNIDFKKAIKAMFNNVSFSNYIYSLPMGAGKTYLMASFIYLDLYFALNEPTNKAFAHNFIICAPSGLKSSVIPSLKSIRDFDATWILPSEAVKQIKDILKFEILDEDKTGNKSNKVKNPNVQKIATHQ